MRAVRSGRSVAVTLAGALAVLVVALVLALSDRDVHLAGTNNVFNRFPVAEVGPREELCEQFETVPAGAAVVQFSVQAPPGSEGGPLAVQVLRDGHAVSVGRRPGGWGGSSVDVPIDTVQRTISNGRVCVTNRGHRPVTLLGYGIEPKRLGFRLRGELPGEQVRLTYLRAEPESWWGVAGVVGHRLGVGRGELFGGWMVFAWLVGVFAMGAVAVMLVLRSARA